MQDKRETPIVNEKIVMIYQMLKFSHCGWGYLTCIQWLWGTDKQTDLHTWNNFYPPQVKLSFEKKNSMSVGLVLLEKLFMHM